MTFPLDENSSVEHTVIMSSADFYDTLTAFSDFHEIAADAPFAPLPDDWKVIVADIQDSTAAIEAGRYKDVNTIGAACIVAAQNAMDKAPFPYVFGGDGATLVVPPGAAEKVCAALDGVRRLAQEKFGMTLRVGMVEAAELHKDGALIEVAKFQLVGKQVIAVFRGGGLAEADKRVKKDPERYTVAHSPRHRENLEGLSCRWQAIPSEKGRRRHLPRDHRPLGRRLKRRHGHRQPGAPVEHELQIDPRAS